jgi:hypothetical protein
MNDVKRTFRNVLATFQAGTMPKNLKTGEQTVTETLRYVILAPIVFLMTIVVAVALSL